MRDVRERTFSFSVETPLRVDQAMRAIRSGIGAAGGEATAETGARTLTLTRYRPVWATGLGLILIPASVPALIVTEWGAALFALGVAVFFFGTKRQ